MCLLSKDNHNIDTCIKFLKLNNAQRCDEIRAKIICSKCLKTAHNFSMCNHNCKSCKGRHHYLLCRGNSFNKVGTNVSNPSNSNNNVSNSSNSNANNNVLNSPNVNNISSSVTEVATPSSSVLLQHKVGNKVSVLQTAKTFLVSKFNNVQINVICDSGSDRSYILSDIAESNKLPVTGWEEIVFNNFGSIKSSKPTMSKVFHIKLLGVDNVTYSLNAIGIPNICKPLYRQPIPQTFLDNLNIHPDTLSDDFLSDREFQVHLLIGLDHLWDIVNPLKCLRYENLIAHDSIFGWVLSGSFSRQNSREHVNSSQLCCFSVSNEELKNFWSLDVVGITPNEKRECNQTGSVVKKFNETLKFENNKYTVNLLWKEPKLNIINNIAIATKRHNSLERHLQKDSTLKQQYEHVFHKYETQGKIEEIPPNEIDTNHNIFYLPHFPVVKENKKVRPVFDGSSKSHDNISLNDTLETGPALQLKIFSILIRFRRWLIGVFSDVESAFHAIKLDKIDQDACRFLLRNPDGTLRHMRFTVLPFGLNCSPYLLNAVILHHINKYPNSNTIHKLKQNIYVDDFTSGCDQPNTAKIIHDEANEILADGGLHLCKWTSTNQEVQDFVGFNKIKSTYILGMGIDLEQDTFSFKLYDFSELSVEYTKRVLLTFIAKPFDPPGFISPFIMTGKILLQQVWRLGLGWDVVLPSEIAEKVHDWVQSTKHFQTWSLPRCYFPGIGWDAISDLEVHGFCDASLQGYGAVVYLRIHTQNGYQTAFVAAKGRAAPVKKITLPRLELMSGVLCARLVDTVIIDLELSNKNYQTFYWTDSLVSWHWIRTDPYDLTMFVSNRVSTIQSISSPSAWHHCPGTSNPCDILSRGCLMDKLISSRYWLHGPAWLSNDIDFENIPKHSLDDQLSEIYQSEKVAHSLTCLNVLEINFNIASFKNYTTILHIMAYVLRFIYNCRNTDRMTGPFSTYELQQAELRVIYVEQHRAYSDTIRRLSDRKVIKDSLAKFHPFLDGNGMLRISTGRCENNITLSYTAKFPLILPEGHLSELILRYMHIFLKHAGLQHILNIVRDKFWIIAGRRTAARVIRECPRCNRYDSRPLCQPSPSLPSFRANQ